MPYGTKKSTTSYDTKPHETKDDNAPTHSETERDRDRTEEQTRKSVRTEGDAVKNDTEKMEKRQSEPRSGQLLW